MLNRLQTLLKIHLVSFALLSGHSSLSQEYFKKYIHANDLTGSEEIEVLEDENLLFCHLKNSDIKGQDTLFLIKYNTCGEPVLSQKYSFNYDDILGASYFTKMLKIEPLGHPYLLLGGILNGDRSLLLMKFSKDASRIIWAKSYSYTPSFVYEFTITSKSNIFIGLCPLSGYYGSHPEVLKIDSSGNVISYFQLNDPLGSVLYNFSFQDETYFLFHLSNSIKKIDLSGNILWHKSYQNISDIMDIEPNSNGYTVVGSDVSDLGSSNVFYIDKSGKVIKNGSQFKNFDFPRLSVSSGKTFLVGRSPVPSPSPYHLFGRIYELSGSGKAKMGYYQTDFSVEYYPDFSYYDNSLHYLGYTYDPSNYDVSLIRGKISPDTANFFCKDGISFDTTTCPTITSSSWPLSSSGSTDLNLTVSNLTYSVFPASLPVDSQCYLIRNYSNLFTIDSLIMCKGDYLDITRPEIYGTSFSWSTGDTTETIRVTKEGPYWVNMTFPCDDSVYTDTVFVNFYPEPLTEILTHPQAAELDEPINFNLANHNYSDSVYWRFQDGFTTAQTNFSRSYESSGWKYFSLYIFTPNGCTTILNDSVLVNFQEVSVPNVFTPNGDGINDIMLIEGEAITTFDLLIFDRWGGQVAELKNEYWDGKNKSGSNSADGVYFYIFTYTTTTGEALTKKGNVTLMSSSQ